MLPYLCHKQVGRPNVRPDAVWSWSLIFDNDKRFFLFGADNDRRMEEVKADLEQETIPRGNGQGCNLRQSIRPGLEDDEEDPNGGGDLLQREVLGNLHPAQHLPTSTTFIARTWCPT